MYMILKYVDVLAAFPDLYTNCYMDSYMLSIDRATTSFSGFTDFLITFIWRYFGDEDVTLYTELSQAIEQDDRVVAGARMGSFIKQLLKTNVPDSTGQDDYVAVAYFSA